MIAMERGGSARRRRRRRTAQREATPRNSAAGAGRPAGSHCALPSSQRRAPFNSSQRPLLNKTTSPA